MADPSEPDVSDPLSKADFEALARFRFEIRRYLRVSEEIVRGRGVTPQQYQLMLALMGYPGREWATVQELSDLMQRRHHSVVELVNRAQAHGLVRRDPHPSDARAVKVSLTAEGERTLARLSALHRDELRRLGSALSHPFRDAPAPSSQEVGPGRGRPLSNRRSRTAPSSRKVEP